MKPVIAIRVAVIAMSGLRMSWVPFGDDGSSAGYGR